MRSSIKNILRTIILFTLIPLLFSCSAPKEEITGRVFLITLDTTRADHIGCYGYKKIETPNIDTVAQEGVLFTNALCQVPVTLPSHVSIMTGLYPPEHGVRHNTGNILKENVVTLAEMLREKGYRTAAFVSAYAVARKWGLAQGFESYDDFFAADEEGMLDLTPKAERRANITIASAIDWIRRNKDAKIFLWIHLFDPHADYEPPMPFSEKYKESPYDGEIAFMDGEIGKLWQFLKAEKLWNDSLIILLGDHGEALGEHHEKTHSTLIYNSTIRVPLIMKSRSLPKQRTIEDVASTVDILPTILDYLKLPVPSELKGKSLLSFVNGNTHDQRDIYMETLSPRINYGWSELTGLRRGKWKFIQAPVPELYDLEKDPHETVNLSLKEKDMAKELARALGEMQKGFERSGGGYSQSVVIDDESRDALLSLGYVSASLSRSGKGQHKNPKDLAFLEADVIRCTDALEIKDYTEVIKICNSILAQDPENKAAIQMSALALMKMEKQDAAIDRLKKLLDLYPDDLQGPKLLCKLYMRKKMFPEAETVLRQALDYYPDSFTYNFEMALCLYTQRRVNEALPWAEKAVSANPSNFLGYAFLANCYAILGMNDQANIYLEEAKRLGFKDDRPITRPDH